MRSTRKRLLILLALQLPISSWMSGCAMLGLDSADESGWESDEELKNDPIAQAALPLRQQKSPGRAPASADSEYPALPQQLTLGMSMAGVRSLWGQPADVEIAGDRHSGNQRWVYSNGLSRASGAQGYRVVYFERGQVAGWESGTR